MDVIFYFRFGQCVQNLIPNQAHAILDNFLEKMPKLIQLFEISLQNMPLSEQNYETILETVKLKWSLFPVQIKLTLISRFRELFIDHYEEFLNSNFLKILELSKIFKAEIAFPKIKIENYTENDLILYFPDIM